MEIEGTELEGSNWNVTSHLAAKAERVQNYVQGLEYPRKNMNELLIDYI